MSKYPVTYWSESKQAHLNLEDMPTPHLMNAWRKTAGMTDAAHQYMEVELVSRGCTYNAETERWELPPKPGGAAP